MNIVVVPGLHPPRLTHRFVQSLQPLLKDAWIVPGQSIPVYSPQHVFTFLQQQWRQTMKDAELYNGPSQSLIFIGFSAGVVGSLGAARLWQTMGNQVLALIALDGWGVPLYGEFPIHRVSHDFWTHWSSGYFGHTQESFYVEPAIDHLDLWRSPHTASGIRTKALHPPHHPFVDAPLPDAPLPDAQQPETAASFVRSLLEHYMDGKGDRPS